jgi:ABC-type branched-subunit amino acid transport system ATPase component/ABC-type branched-subunit amino acid transport system permease subunit
MLYGLLAVGLVLVYRSNKFLNLAHGQLGALAALLLAKMTLDAGWSYWIAFPVSIAVGAATGIVVERLFVAKLRTRTSSAVSLLLLTIGVSQLLLALLYIPALQPDQLRLIERHYPLPLSTHFVVGGVVFGGQYVLVLILAPLLVAALATFLRLTMTGRMIRAAANNEDEARLCGISPRRVSTITWGIAGVLSAVSAILQAPSNPAFSAPSLGPDQLFVALGAAAFGGFVSIPMTLVGGIVIGVVQQVTIGMTSNTGTAQLVVFILILAVVLLRGGAIGAAFSASGAAVDDRPPLRISERVRDRWMVRSQSRLFRFSMLALALLLPLLPGLQTDGHRFQLTVILIYAVVGVSLTALIGWGGQLSLGHLAVVGLGAMITARLAGHGWSLPILLVFAGMAGGVAMVVIGLPALRVRGLTLAVTTLGLAIVANEWLLRQKWLTGSDTPNVDASPIRLLRGGGHLTSSATIYYTALAVLVVVVLTAHALRHSTPGRVMIAVRDDERVSAAYGVTPATVKLTSLAVSGFFAGAVGVLWAAAWRTVTPDQFAPGLSLAILAVPVIGGLGSVGGAVAGAFVLYFPVYFISPYLSGLLGPFGQAGFQVLWGGLSMIGILLIYPTGIAGAVQRGWEKFLERVSEQLPDRQPDSPAGQPLLTARDVDVRFGGVHALRGASFEVHEGEIVGLIGPNGAGKSTLLNVVSGTLRPEKGSVTLLGKDISTLPPELRAAHGLGRSFQAAPLFPGLTVRETLQAALGSRARIGVLSSMLRLPWAQRAERRMRLQADELLGRMGLAAWADVLTADISTGTRRICDLTVQLAGRPRVLLLDEPTAGVAQRETEQFGPLLRRLRSELSCSIVIVEHDMPLLMSLCDIVYAMEGGRIIAVGTPSEIRDDPQVISSYLGTDETAIARSGARSARRAAGTSRGATGTKARPLTASTRRR